MKRPIRFLPLAPLLLATFLPRFHACGQTPQTITWTIPKSEAVLRVGPPFLLSATASSGLPVTFRVKSGPAVVANGTVAVTGVGTIVLIAEQAGDATYAPISLERTINR